uniref:Putative ribonuclease H-like domain-containing protein n=1 Tax=Tanacetum cinerariifolium TaxID=118510 RepID=A0A699KNQ3_TANCI|nr:putative ribonuclease H-like domain-containing protein [Tanacetum cinerariifolium]
MLADSLLPIPFWTEAFNTACYVQNRVLVTKPHNKTPYELLYGTTPSISFIRPFGCHVTILNTLDSLGKFNGKVDKGFLVGYSVSREENVQQYVLFPVWSSGSKNPHNTDGEAEFEVKKTEFEVHVSPSNSAKIKKHDDKIKERLRERIITSVPAVGQNSTNSTNTFSVAGPSNTVVSPTHREYSYMNPSQYPDDPDMPTLEDITHSDYEDDVGAEADFTNLETTITVSPIPITRVHRDHHISQIIGDLSTGPLTKSTKWVFRNKKDERGIVVRNKARLVAQGHTVYQMDVKSAFMYGTIKEEVYVCQPLRFEDPDYPDKVYKVFKALYGLHQAPKAWYETLANYLLENGFQMGKIDQTLFIKRQKGDILLV